MVTPILIYNYIKDSLLETVHTQLLAHEGDTIDVYMNTKGGSITAGYAIINELHLAKLKSKKKVNITVTGDANSMGAFMLLFADNVKAFSTSIILLHRASWGDYEKEMTADEANFLKTVNNALRKRLSEQIDEVDFKKVTGKSFDDLFSMDKRIDIRLTAKQAKTIGLIDDIISVDTKRASQIKAHYTNQLTASTGVVEAYHNELLKLTKNDNKMTLFERLLSKKANDDEVVLFEGKIGEQKIVFASQDVGAEIVPLGTKNKVSGVFAHNDKKITVVDNVISEITAVAVSKDSTELEFAKTEIEKLKNEIGQLRGNIDAKLVKLSDETFDALNPIIEALAVAKIKVSNGVVPKANPVLDQTEITNKLTSEPTAHEKRQIALDDERRSKTL